MASIGRSFHAACCIGYGGDYVNILLSGGIGIVMTKH